MATKNTSGKGAKAGAKAPKEIEKLVITQEIFDLNKDFLEAEGVEVGNEIEFTKELKKELVMPEANVGGVDETANKPVPSKAPGKISCPVSILKGEEYIRTYEKGQEDEAKGFLAKNPNFVAVDPDDIESISVTWRETEKKRDEQTGRLEDTGRLVTKLVVFSEKNNGAEWKSLARRLANEAPKRSCVAKLAK